MEEILIGTYIRQKRQEKGWTQEYLSEGICDPATLSRIENNERPPSIRVANALLQKMGLSSAPYLALLGKADIMAEKLHKEIIDDKIRFRRALGEEKAHVRKQILQKLQKLEKMCGEDDRFIRQFVLSTQAEIGMPDGPYSAKEKLDILTEAIQLTIPSFHLKKVANFRYSVEEVVIVNNMVRIYTETGNRKKAIGLFSQLLRNLEKNNQELDMYPRQFCLIAHNCAIVLAQEGEYDKAVALAQKGLDMSKKTGYFQFLPGFVAILAECSFFLGDSQQSANFYGYAYTLYKLLGDTENLEIMKQEMKEHLNLEPPYQIC